jgi:cytochrome c556
VASRREIMSRLERVRAYVKQGVTTEAQFNKELDKVAHEAAVLRAMVRVVATEGYDLSDDDLYKEYTNELIDAGQKITDAVQNKDFNAFNEAVNRIEKACSACHQEYKNS